MTKKLSIAIVSLLTFSFLLSSCASKEETAAINAFQKATNRVERMNKNLDKQISEAKKLINKNEKSLDENSISTLETALSSAKSSKIIIPKQPSDLKSLKSETTRLNKVDYTKQIKHLNESKIAYKNGVMQLKKVTNPSENYIIEKIKPIEGITGISAVTEDNDPNGQLGKQGGYTAQIYFSYKLIDQSTVDGNSIIDKGTDCGGSIEVYKTAKDANKRNEYLASFDGGLFSSGYHSVHGSVIIRISNLLTASQQKDLAAKILNSLVELK